MDTQIWNFVTRFREAGDNYNFISQLPNFLGKFRVERKNIEEFWDLYCKKQTETSNFVSGLSEKPSEYQPLIVDIDLSRKIKDGDDQTMEKNYTLQEAQEVIKVYQKVIRETIREWKPRNCACFLLEKEKPYLDKGEIKGGFHLHFPRLWIRNCDHELHIIPRVVKYLNDNNPNLFHKLKGTLSGDCVDKGITKKFWLLYGGCKDPVKGSYKLTKVFDCNVNEITLSEALSGYKLYNSQEEEIKLDDSNYMYYMPRILSTHSANQTIMFMKTNLECITKQTISTAKERTAHHENLNVSENVELARELMPLISETRADSYDTWMEIGWVLYNIGDGCQEALDLWIEFSSKTSRNNFDEAYCIYQWQKMLNTHKYTTATLRYYASIDTPEGYETWKKKRAASRIKESLQGGHNDLAKMLYDCYGNVYTCASAEKGTLWYEFREHRWHRIEKGLSLRKKISEDLVTKFHEEARKIYSEMAENDDDDDTLQKKIKLVNTIIKNLKTAPFKDNIMKEAVEIFHNQDFLAKLDSDTHLMGFTNGVLDLRTMKFRDGKPEDFISLNTGYEYKEFKDCDPEVLEVKDFFLKLFPDPLLRRYFLEYSAYLLRGGNINKIFLTMTGEGDNGKSVAIELIQQTLGKYCIKFPTALITGKRTQSSSATPELARIHGIRFGTLQEPDGKDVINVGILKELTGNDGISVRGLFQDQKDITPMLKIALICNTLPRLSSQDPAHWNRIRVLPFEAKFPKNAAEVPKTLEEQIKKKIFPRNSNFNEKLPQMKQALMWLLVQTLKEIDQNGPTEEPDKVKEATAIYRKNNDLFLQYITECIIEETQVHSTLSINELYLSFTQWFKDSFPNLKIPTKNDLKEELVRRWGPSNENMRWSGFRLRTIRDDIQESKALILESIDSDDDLEVNI